VTRAPAPGADAALQARAEAGIRPLLDELDYVGVACVELFDVDGALLANEMAPRVHNSGHWTIEGADTSQFENHLRAVLGWPLGSTAAGGASAMVNCIGAMPDRVALLAIPGAHVHDYEKAPRRARKVGHVTCAHPTPTRLQLGSRACGNWCARQPTAELAPCPLRRPRRSLAAWRGRRRRHPSRRGPRRCAGRPRGVALHRGRRAREARRGRGLRHAAPLDDRVARLDVLVVRRLRHREHRCVTRVAAHEDRVPLVSRLRLEQLREPSAERVPAVAVHLLREVFGLEAEPLDQLRRRNCGSSEPSEMNLPSDVS